MSKMMEYRGYHAKVHFDPDDEILIGEVFGINDSLNFHATSTSELKEMFRQSIDNYLEMCEICGKIPDKEYSGTFNVRIPPELHRESALRAQTEGVSLNRVVEHALTAYLNPEPEAQYTIDPGLLSLFGTSSSSYSNAQTVAYGSQPYRPLMFIDLPKRS